MAEWNAFIVTRASGTPTRPGIGAPSEIRKGSYSGHSEGRKSTCYASRRRTVIMDDNALGDCALGGRLQTDVPANLRQAGLGTDCRGPSAPSELLCWPKRVLLVPARDLPHLKQFLSASISSLSSFLFSSKVQRRWGEAVGTGPDTAGSL